MLLYFACLKSREKEREIREMRSKHGILIKLLVIEYLTVICFAARFDFYYFVQQWPVSYCDTRRSCCYPKTGKPAEDFSIHGLWPNYNNGKYPQNCNPDNPFDQSQISDLVGRLERDWPTLACPSGDGLRFWEHEWEKHGTCSESIMNQHDYFRAALDLKNRANLLQILKNAGIQPGNSYKLNRVKEAIRQGVGYPPFIECNVDPEGNHQLYQVYLCVDASASGFVECPVMPHGRGCGSEMEFPSFSSGSQSRDDNDEL